MDKVKGFKKYNGRVIQEVFEYGSITDLDIRIGPVATIASFDERNVGAVVELLRSIADRLEYPQYVTQLDLFELFFEAKDIEIECNWYMNANTAGRLRLALDNMFTVTEHGETRLLGRPIVIAESMPDIGKGIPVIFSAPKRNAEDGVTITWL